MEGRSLRLPAEGPDLAVRHEGVRDLSAYLEKMNRYTSQEAVDLLRDGAPVDHSCQALLAAFAREWTLHYDRLRARDDGMHGFVFSFRHSFYRFATLAKVRDERRRIGQAEEEPLPRGGDQLL